MITSSQSATPLQTMTLTGNTNTLTTTSGVSGVVLTKPINQSVGTQQTIVGNSPQIVPTNVQILNVNALRANAPNQTGAKTIPQRVMITPQMARPGQPGQITLQTLQGLGTQGHLLLKTENGQYRLLRVGPPSAGAGQQAQTTPISGNNVNAFRVQTISGANTPGGAVQTQVPALATQSSATVTHNNVIQQRGAVDQTKEKCRKFLANLLELSSREPKAVEKSVRTLIQELVDMKVEPEQFCDRLERLLNASPQPCLIGFLKKSLPLLRQSMVNNELIIDGIRPPPTSLVAPTTTLQTNATTTPQIRGQLQMSTTPQMRVITQPNVLRPGQQVQHRIISPVRMGSNIVTTGGKTGITTIRTPVGTLRPQIVRTPTQITLRPGQTITSKPQFASRPLITSSQFSSPVVMKPGQQQPMKEKRTFSSSGYVGDDDINDVAAMGGVNLQEESQRILGSTEFVGTQIRSCKDELYLHTIPLMNRITRIARKHGLDEPNVDVASLISHATQERLKSLVEKLSVIAEHRIDLNKADPRYEVTQDVRAQLKCIEEVDRAERKRHEEQERELLLRAAKSRTKPEDPEQAKLKAKAKEMQRAEMEELRQREANLTALLAIGPRKKAKIEDAASVVGSAVGSGSSSTAGAVLRPRTKRVCLRDLLILMEQEKETSRGSLLYKSYFK